MAVAMCGGGSFTELGRAVDDALLAASGATEVVLVTAAAAFEHPERQVEAASAYFAGRATVRALPVATRADARDQDVADSLEGCALLYLTGGSPMHLRSVLKDTVLWEAIAGVHRAGGLVVAEAEAATVITDPMTDPRGGAFTLGLGLVSPLAVLPRHETWSPERSRRTRELAPAGICVLNLDSGAGVLGDADGWRQLGTAPASVYLDGHPVGFDRLPAV